MQRIFIREFKKFCKGVQGKKLLLPQKATKSFALASGRALRKWTAEIKVFPLQNSQDLTELL